MSDTGTNRSSGTSNVSGRTIPSPGLGVVDDEDPDPPEPNEPG